MSAESIIFPKLYKKTSTGAIQEWQIEVKYLDIQSVITSKFGQVGGKIQESYETINEGKNIGKMITVQYQDYTQYGVPRFPVAMRFREDI